MAIELLGWFKKKTALKDSIKVDLHSHLIPGIDDGVKTFEESVSIIKAVQELGFRKIITTPHIMQGYYENSAETIMPKLDSLKSMLQEEGIHVELAAAAEYFLDETFVKALDYKQQLLTINNEYLLFETAFLNKPIFLEETIFKIKSIGLKPLLAHPERYNYLVSEPSLALRLREMGCNFQVNLRSLSKANSLASREFVKWMFSQKLVDFFGSDIHNERHLQDIEKILNLPLFDENDLMQVKNNILL